MLACAWGLLPSVIAGVNRLTGSGSPTYYAGNDVESYIIPSLHLTDEEAEAQEA